MQHLPSQFQQRERDVNTNSSPMPSEGRAHILAGVFLSKVKDRIVEKIFQTSTEGPQLAAVIQERRYFSLHRAVARIFGLGG